MFVIKKRENETLKTFLMRKFLAEKYESLLYKIRALPDVKFEPGGYRIAKLDFYKLIFNELDIDGFFKDELAIFLDISTNKIDNIFDLVNKNDKQD